MEPTKQDPIKRLLWLDLETTGLDPAKSAILEVGWVITDLHLNELSDPQQRVNGNRRNLDDMDDFVRKMHTDNGLVLAVNDSRLDLGDMERFVLGSMKRAEREVPEGAPEIEWVLAGTGVATFDLQVLKFQMPELAAKLAYYTFDVGVVRRFLRDVIEYPFTVEQWAAIESCRPLDHRAVTDALAALGEARVSREIIGAEHPYDAAQRRAKGG